MNTRPTNTRPKAARVDFHPESRGLKQLEKRGNLMNATAGTEQMSNFAGEWVSESTEGTRTEMKKRANEVLGQISAGEAGSETTEGERDMMNTRPDAARCRFSPGEAGSEMTEGERDMMNTRANKVREPISAANRSRAKAPECSFIPTSARDIALAIRAPSRHGQPYKNPRITAEYHLLRVTHRPSQSALRRRPTRSSPATRIEATDPIADRDPSRRKRSSREAGKRSRIHGRHQARSALSDKQRRRHQHRSPPREPPTHRAFPAPPSPNRLRPIRSARRQGPTPSQPPSPWQTLRPRNPYRTAALLASRHPSRSQHRLIRRVNRSLAPAINPPAACARIISTIQPSPAVRAPTALHPCRQGHTSTASNRSQNLSDAIQSPNILHLQS